MTEETKKEIKAFAEAIWDNATNEDEVGARWDNPSCKRRISVV